MFANKNLDVCSWLDLSVATISMEGLDGVVKTSLEVAVRENGVLDHDSVRVIHDFDDLADVVEELKIKRMNL